MNYTVGNTIFQGYMVFDNNTRIPGKGVVIIPDWNGADGYEFWRADALAAEGYTGVFGG